MAATQNQIMEHMLLRAFDELSDALFRHCYYRVYDRERAKEIVQETFTKTWEYLAKGGTIENMKAFLYRVATNLIIDESRKKKTLSLEEMQETGFDPSGKDFKNMVVGVEGKEMIKLLTLLDEKYRVPIVMRFIDDLLPKHIAEILGETENTISVRIHRGIEQIRKILSTEEKLS